MCLICAEIKSEKLTSSEARNNLSEVYTTLEKDHILEILKLIWKREDQELKYLDEALNELEDLEIKEYEEEVDIWKTFGGD
tara:strand:- start:863 stop:1105 length:243 start_codon:yes stop_codon:yes gene_type:complete